MITEEILDRIKKCLDLSDVDEAIPIIQACIIARDRIMYSADKNFKMGDLVLDERDNEIGFVIGPINQYHDINETRISLTTGSGSENTRSRTFLIVTRPIQKENKVVEDNNDSSIDKKDLKGFHLSQLTSISSNIPSNYRVRYINENWLTLLGLEDDKQKISDLEIFCNSQCLMECTSECKLYKYKRNKL